MNEKANMDFHKFENKLRTNSDSSKTFIFCIKKNSLRTASPDQDYVVLTYINKWARSNSFGYMYN